MGKEKKPRCSKLIFDQYHWSGRNCEKAGVITEDGKCWCRIHAPSAVKKRHEAWRAKYDAEQAAESAIRKRERRRHEMFSELLAALKLHAPDKAASVIEEAEKLL